MRVWTGTPFARNWNRAEAPKPLGVTTEEAVLPRRSRTAGGRRETMRVAMARVEGEITISRPVEEAFDFVADERNEPRYNAHMVRAEQISEGPIGEGTRFHTELRRWVGRCRWPSNSSATSGRDGLLR
jgi:hypothetical protein